jgi:uncharacterized protein
MRLSEIAFNDGVPVDAYGPGYFRIGGEVRNGPQLILPTGAVDWGGYNDTSMIVEAADDLDVLFVGTGSETAHCRTYNILLSEGRRVGVALLPVGPIGD